MILYRQTNYYRLGIDLKKELEKRNMTFREFDKIVGIHFATLNAIANGRVTSADRAFKIINTIKQIKIK